METTINNVLQSAFSGWTFYIKNNRRPTLIGDENFLNQTHTLGEYFPSTGWWIDYTLNLAGNKCLSNEEWYKVKNFDRKGKELLNFLENLGYNVKR